MKSGLPSSFLQLFKRYGIRMCKDKNFVWSPCSIHLALSLLANGSTGLTKEEFLSILEEENLEDLNLRNEKLIASYHKVNKGDPVLAFLGGVWVDQSLILKTSFKERAANIYKAKAENVDFQNGLNVEEVVDKVNQWATEATNGLIRSLLAEGSFNTTTRLVLANALYFKGAWHGPFEPEFTRNHRFYLLDGTSVKVPFMTSGSDRSIATFDEFKILRLPYSKEGHKRISMYIILPNQKDGLWSLVKKVGLDPFFLETHVQQTRYVPVTGVGKFRIPKFKIAYEFDASKILKAVGLMLPFSYGAEFDEMVENKVDVAVSKVHHKSYIEVDEEGTEAIATTVDDSDMASAIFDDPSHKPLIDFVADHPFMFIIRDDLHEVVLFVGHVVNPSLE